MDKKQIPPVHSLVAGTIAGAVEGAVTYPTELIKTKLQLQGSEQYIKQAGHQYRGALHCLQHTVGTQGIGGLYRGLLPMLVGNASKAGVRFLTYDSIKAQLKPRDGQPMTAWRLMAAGLCAGVVEGALVVAPTEALKTRLIRDHCMPKPRYAGAWQCLGSIGREDPGGLLRGLYRGVGPVMARQGANSCVRFAVYDSMKQWLVGRTEKKIGGMQAFVLGMAAGTVTVYATMPLDVVKTRMQAAGGPAGAGEYRGSVHCAASIVRNEGVWALWKGATPRLARLVFSGAIVFAVYEQVVQALR
ncbi:hypothetical protein GGI07_004568 [Coemansia sp. Benny D115]|nr:hypothetical protein GGI07_004568 [Coemansia sp. Benny D115]